MARDEDDDAEGNEEPLGLRVEDGDPVDEAEHYHGLEDLERHLHNLLCKEESVCSVHPIKVFPVMKSIFCYSVKLFIKFFQRFSPTREL